MDNYTDEEIDAQLRWEAMKERVLRVAVIAGVAGYVALVLWAQLRPSKPYDQFSDPEWHECIGAETTAGGRTMSEAMDVCAGAGEEWPR